MSGVAGAARCCLRFPPFAQAPTLKSMANEKMMNCVVETSGMAVEFRIRFAMRTVHTSVFLVIMGGDYNLSYEYYTGFTTEGGLANTKLCSARNLALPNFRMRPLS